jgi:hypothetical protein
LLFAVERRRIAHSQGSGVVGMPQGANGFRYWHADRPVNYRTFERCHCGVTDLPHYKMRGLGSGKCIGPEQYADGGAADRA